MNSDYRAAGVDLTAFVEAWLVEVEAKADTGLLRKAVDDPFEADRYFYGMAGLMSEIAPRVWGDAGGHEELLLYAVLACYQEHLGHHQGVRWPGSRAHVLRAFAYVRRIGERAAADLLRRKVAQRGTLDEARREMDEGGYPAKRRRPGQGVAGLATGVAPRPVLTFPFE